jgi:hypothetical protein
MKLPIFSLDKKQQGIAAISLGAVTLTAAALAALFSTGAPPELAVTPTLDCDPTWLTSATPDISYSAEQVRRFLDNRDRSLCNGQSMMGALTSRMAQKYLASAITDTANPKHPCSKGTVMQCLASYGKNITNSLEKAKTADQSAAALQKLLALTYAVDAYSTGKNIPVITGPSNEMARLLIQNLTERDAKEAAQASLDGQARSIRQEVERGKATEQELSNEIIELN